MPTWWRKRRIGAADGAGHRAAHGGAGREFALPSRTSALPNGQSSVDVAGEVIAGRYELEELTGSGGMSRVYRARDNQLGRLVAVKILHERFSDDAEYVDRFRREALAVARLNHPNIVTVIDRGEADGLQYIVFEHVEGEDLKHLIARTGPLPVRRALELAVQIGRALSFAHAHGVVHRDVKPQNVLLRDGSAKVTDFGIARADHLELDAERTDSGTVLGTGDYISPEQARGERASERSDVYSLGALLYELLTGDVPFPAESAVAAALRHTTDPVPDVLAARPDVPVRVAGAVERALAKDPDDRFATMDEFVDELVACRSELPAPEAAQTMILSEPVSPVPPRSVARTRRGGRVVATLLVLLVLAGIAGGAYYVWHEHDGTSSAEGTPPSPAAPVHLQAVSAFDPPPGDGTERDDLVGDATDGSTSTSWQTERYTTAKFGNLKPGVGLVLDAGRPVQLGSLAVTSGTSGFVAVIKAGSSPEGPFTAVSSEQTAGSKTTFTLHVPGKERYYMIWITELVRSDTGDPSKSFISQIAEVTATR
jgi:eukaryotic-like serine/threonine-protein kinase